MDTPYCVPFYVWNFFHLFLNIEKGKENTTTASFFVDRVVFGKKGKTKGSLY